MRILVLAIALAACFPVARAPVEPSTAIHADNAARLDAAIRSAAERLRDLARPDGSFIYEYRVGTGAELGGYNIVRHAGAIYALAMYEQTAPDERTRAVIAAASRYLIERAIRPLEPPADASAVFSMPARGEVGADAVLGATGLGVVALLAADAIAPGTIAPATLRQLGNFILMMQRPDGSFFSTYTADGGTTSDFDSLYYPGEAILALARLSAWDRDPRWHDAALRGIRFLAASRASASDVPSDNWALIATEELLHHGDVDARDRTLLLHHADQIATVNTSTQQGDPKRPLFGCYTDDGRTTPSSTHLEGLLAAATFLSRAELQPSIDAGIHFLLESQLPDGAMPADQRKRTVRIDYIQHALSAFIRYRDMR